MPRPVLSSEMKTIAWRWAHLRFVKILVPKIGESFVLGHNVESQEVAQARPSPELACALETILELAALRLHCAGSDRSATLSHSLVIKMITVIEEVLDLTL